MDERIHPSAKPPSSTSNGHAKPPASTSNGQAKPLSFPPSKSQAFARPLYRPQPPKRRRSRRGCCRSCCLWTTLTLAILLFLAAIAGTIFYFVYRPRAPKFSVSSLRIATFNVSNWNSLTSRIDITVSASNPNKKLVYLYDDSAVSVISNDIDIGHGSFPGFVLEAGNITKLKTVAVNSGLGLDAGTAADLKKKSELAVDVVLDGKARVKVGGLKTKNVKVRVTCKGVTVAVPKGKAHPAASSPASGCKVKLRVKIWKWYL